VLQAEREEQAVIDSIAVREIGDLRIGVSRQPLGRMVERAFQQLGVDVLIAPNEREPDKVSVVRDSQGRYRDIPVAELLPALAERATFVHPAGFMMVAALSVDEALGLL
jgi:glutamate mutase epsilon subunit